MHLSNIEDSVGETSGGDSYGGYEGVEHLKRHSLSHARAASCESLAYGCRAVAAATDGVRPSLGNYGAGNMRRRGVTALGVSARLNSLNSAFYGGGTSMGDGGGGQSIGGGESGSGSGPVSFSGVGVTGGDEVAEESFIFVEKSHLDYHVASCEVLRDGSEVKPSTGQTLSRLQKIGSPLLGERKTWHEDEAFVKQVVEEYFQDPVEEYFKESTSLSDCDVNKSEASLPPAETKSSIIVENLALQGSSAGLHKSSSCSSSSSSTGSASGSSSSEENEKGNVGKGVDCGSPSVDTTYCDTDESNSWFTDDSEGYEADAEPSDKDTLRQVWRRWRSAPDVRLPSDVRAKLRGQQLGQAAAAAAPLGDAAYSSGRGNSSATKNGVGRGWWRDEVSGVEGQGGEATAHAIPYKHSLVCGYQTRKSCSVDETKLSRLRLGLRKVKEHKLLQFPQHDLDRKRRPSKVNCQSTRNDSARVGGEGTLNSVNTSSDTQEADAHVFTAGVENLEFVNGKYKTGSGKTEFREVVCECVRKTVDKVSIEESERCGERPGCRDNSVEGSVSVDDSTTERTQRVLSQGLIIHHSSTVHDSHSILNASVIKNALSILRESIAAQELETTKPLSCATVATSGECGMPSERGESKGRDTENTSVNNEEDEVQVGYKVAEVESQNTTHLTDGIRTLKNQDESGSAVEEAGNTIKGAIEQGHAEGASVYKVQRDSEMNKSNVTIHLTPPLPRRPSKDDETKSCTGSTALTQPSVSPPQFFPLGSRERSAGKVYENDSCTYQNIEPQDGSSVKSESHQMNDRLVSGSNQRLRLLLKADPSQQFSSMDSSRSVRTSPDWRASTASTDTLSSSSGTSSCCHTRPKLKSKTSKKLSPQSPGHSRRRQNVADSGSGTTSSSSIKVFGNEFHLHRVQVGTGSDRKFAQATQRTVVEVPVSCGEQSDSQTLVSPHGECEQGGGGATVQKSELVLGPPQFRGSQGSRHKHPPTFLSSSFPNSNICISEYNIGDARPKLPESPGLLAHEFKLSNIDAKTPESVSDAKHDKVTRNSSKSNSKNKSKSKPRKYFSGILNAIGSAGPRLRFVGTGNDNQESGRKEHGERVVSEGSSGIVFPCGRTSGCGYPTPNSGDQLAECRSRPPTTSLGDGKPHVAISTKIEVIQVPANTKDSASGSSHTISNDVQVPSPRPRRARKNSHDSADNVVGPTPPTRRKNTEISPSKTIINGSNEKSGYRFESPQASPQARRGQEPKSHSVERNFRCNLPASALHPHDTHTDAHQHPNDTNTDDHQHPDVHTQAAYENLTFHEKHSFEKFESPTSANNRATNEANIVTSVVEISQSPVRSSILGQGSDSHRSVQSTSGEHTSSQSAGAHGGGSNSLLHQTSGTSSGHSNGEKKRRHENNSDLGRCSFGDNVRGVTEEPVSGSGKNNSGSSRDKENNQTHTTDSRKEMNGIRFGNYSDEWYRISENVESGRCIKKGNSAISSGADSVSTPGRRRRSRPPSLPTTPPQSSRARRTSQSSVTSGGSLPSSPTRWRRPQAEDTWEDSSIDGSHEGRLSNSPSAESVASESTSFYYSAAGSVYDRPKSFNDDATARYSFVTCPQYEPLTPLQETIAEGAPAPATPVKPQDHTSATNISRTISGDLNCDVDVSLSEGEIKIRVRTEDADVISSTSIHSGDSDNDTDSDSDDYELCSDIKDIEEAKKCDSSDICHSTCDSEKLSIRESEDEPLVSDGMVHAVPCVAGTDSSNRSSLSGCSFPTFHGGYLDSLGSQDSGKRESDLAHATPCWATTDSDMRSSVSSSDYYGKVYLSATHEERVYEPTYENVKEQSPLRSVHESNSDIIEESCSSEPNTQKRRLSGVWTTVGEVDDSEWEETRSTDLPEYLHKVNTSDCVESEASKSPPLVSRASDEYQPVYHDPSECSTMDEEFIPEEVQPISPILQFNRKTSSVDEREPNKESAPPKCSSDSQHDVPGWEPHTAAWEWHKTVWDHHQQLHQHHLHHLRQHHHHHQSLLAEVMSCLGGRWGMGVGPWCQQSYPESAGCPKGSGCAHLQDTPTPDCRCSGHFKDDPPYRPASASSCDMGKPPPSPLPPSGSHKSRDTSSVPREGSRPQSRQSRSRRRAHSANSKYRVELEISPHLLSRPRPSSFSSLVTRRASTNSPEPLEDDLTQEALLYMSETGYNHSVDASRRRLAERKKNEGNELYKNKDYREALKLYTQAIDLCPDCAAYFSNRSACYMMLGKYYEALNDAREAVRLDTSFVKGYLRVAKCNIALGDATAALSVLRQASELEPNNKAIREETTKAQSLIRCQEEVEKAKAKADYRTAIFHLDRALDQAVGCRSLKITKAEYLVFLQRYADAQEMVNEILQYESGNADAIYVRGMCLYYQDNPEAAFNHFQHVLRLAPDHQKARDVYKKAKLLKQKKEEGNEAFKKGNFQEALNLYTEALAIDPLNKHTNAKLYFNRATVGFKLNKYELATEDCTAAINLDEGYVKAYLRRAKCYQLLEKHEEAVRDYEKVTRLDRNQEHKRLLHEAKIELKRSKRKDYYKILGVQKTASDDEIKKSYRKMALVHHPDRHANASDKDKHEHEIKFKEIGEAYSVLTDAKKRAMYDRGQDINDHDGGFGHDDIDPNQIFQAFFGGGHGG
nr:uncharacterized protein LOC128688606 [Cherax quadricarinatus]